MRIDLTTTKVYLISPCTGKYQDRALAVLDRLMTRGFRRIELIRRADDTDTRMITTEPFLLLDDECGLMDGDGVIEVPDDADAVCVGDSPYSTDLDAGDSQCVRIRDITDSHAVLYTNKRATVQTLYALKRPLFQEDSVDVTREQLARLVARDGVHTDRGRLAYVLQKVAAMPSRIVRDLFVDPVVASVLMEAKVATDCGWSPQWAADMLARHGASRI